MPGTGWTGDAATKPAHAGATSAQGSPETSNCPDQLAIGGGGLTSGGRGGDPIRHRGLEGLNIASLTEFRGAKTGSQRPQIQSYTRLLPRSGYLVPVPGVGMVVTPATRWPDEASG